MRLPAAAGAPPPRQAFDAWRNASQTDWRSAWVLPLSCARMQLLRVASLGETTVLCFERAYTPNGPLTMVMFAATIGTAVLPMFFTKYHVGRQSIYTPIQKKFFTDILTK